MIIIELMYNKALFYDDENFILLHCLLLFQKPVNVSELLRIVIPTSAGLFIIIPDILITNYFTSCLQFVWSCGQDQQI